MATEKQIEAALDDIEEDVLIDALMDSNELAFLVRSIVRQAMFGDAEIHVAQFMKDCVSAIRDKHWALAEKLANTPRLHINETMREAA